MDDYKRKYEEALGRAKAFSKRWQGIEATDSELALQELKEIFPDLKESEDEDEKIKEYLISFIKLESGVNLSPDDAGKILAWIEKQDPEKREEELEKAYKTADKAQYRKGYEDAKSEIEKQGGQKQTLPKWKYKKDNTPLLRDSIILNKYGCVAKSPSGALVSDVWVMDYDELAKLPKEETEKQGKQNFTDCHFTPEQADILDKHIDEFLKQKPTDKVESKFKAGDWIISSEGTLRHIVAVDKTGYETDKGWLTHEDYEKRFHLWTIQDAKDGEVLATKNGNPFIYDKNRYNNGLAYYYAGLDVNKELTLKSPHHMLAHFGELCSVSPATKEQRELLFAKMKEAGYEWDAEKKELKKIEQKPEIKDDVLSRFAFYQYDDDAIYLSSLFVRESDRGHGYGSKVLKAAEEVAKTFGISKIRLKVERNTWMEKWYKKNGYEYLSSEGKYDWLENRVILYGT